MSPKNFYWLNGIVSLGAVIFLFWLIYFQVDAGLPQKEKLTFLPALNATLNGLSAIILCFGFWAIKKRKITLHRMLMLSAFTVSAVFLICYIYYHAIHGDTHFQGQGWIRPIYFCVLISHVVFSIVVFPLILTAIFFALTKRFSAHKKIAPYTWGLWLYVSVTGVLVYLMLYVFWAG